MLSGFLPFPSLPFPSIPFLPGHYLVFMIELSQRQPGYTDLPPLQTGAVRSVLSDQFRAKLSSRAGQARAGCPGVL